MKSFLRILPRGVTSGDAEILLSEQLGWILIRGSFKCCCGRVGFRRLGLICAPVEGFFHQSAGYDFCEYLIVILPLAFDWIDFLFWVNFGSSFCVVPKFTLLGVVGGWVVAGYIVIRFKNILQFSSYICAIYISGQILCSVMPLNAYKFIHGWDKRVHLTFLTLIPINLPQPNIDSGSCSNTL